MLANNITDPYYDWPIDDTEFDEYFIDKYSELSKRGGFDVSRWGQDETRTDNIVYYYQEVERENIGNTPLVFSSGSTSYADVTEEQIQQILDNKVVTIDGIQYRLVKE